MGKINVYDKLKTRKDKMWKSNKFVCKSPSKRCFTMEIKAC